MTKTEDQHFHANWASAPGETIADILEERNLSPNEFAEQIGYPLARAKDLLSGRAKITPDAARKLGRFSGSPETFWMRRESQYREDLARLHYVTRGEGAKWLSELPLKDMIKFGWIEDSADQMTACLRFFGVADVNMWRGAYQNIFRMAVFRISRSFESEVGAVAAWLRQGEIESNDLNCKPWDPKRFKGILPEIRALTRKRNPNVFILELQKHCAECGIAVVILRAPAGCRASGATRFLSSTKALLLLSFRYLSDDHFWFTFFHESGHLLLHGKKALFLEGTDGDFTQEEKEANEFAAGILIPPEFYSELLNIRIDGYAASHGCRAPAMPGQAGRSWKVSGTRNRRYDQASAPVESHAGCACGFGRTGFCSKG